jgi:DUF1680 family protein
MLRSNNVAKVPTMNRRNFLKTAAAAPLLAGSTPLSSKSLPSVTSANQTASQPTNAPLRDRYELTRRRVLSGTSPAFTDEFLLADVRPTPGRRFTEYSGDLSGRYIGALATAARVYHADFPGLAPLVEKIVALQKPDGYFGSTFHYDHPTDDDLALLWGNGRLLVGLLEFHRYNPSAHVLAASTRLGDFLVRIAPLMLSPKIREEFGAVHFASSYVCWMQQTEGLSNLYLATHDARYKDVAEQIAAVIERRPGDHVHGYLTSVRGVMDLYQATSDPKYLRQCEDVWRDIAQSQDLLITGGVPEGWSPNKHRTEGCAEADWVRLNIALWNATSNPKYLSMAERATFNEFAFNQFATGDFGHRVLTDTGFAGDGAVRAWWCCTLHGLRAFPDIHASVFRYKDGALSYDLPLDGQTDNNSVKTASLSAAATSSLAHDGKVRITITSAGDSPDSLRIRKPDWAETLTIILNNVPTQAFLEDGHVNIHRRWHAGDVVTVHYAMSLRSQSDDKKLVAYSFGPWLLGASQSDAPAYFNELTTENELSPAKVQTPPAASHAARPFAVPIAATSFHYTPAEFPDQEETVTLRPIAEQTGQPSTNWQLQFLTEES